jgi:SAM-dependent methyltransferase
VSGAPDDLAAVRASYDAVADNYVAMGVGELGAEPWLRAVLDAFAEQVHDIGPVLDAGCGPGQVSAYLSERGVEVRGIDLSPRMIEHARRRHPDIAFEAVSVTDVELEPSSLGGVLGWWSWFNLPRTVLPQVIERLARALRPDGQLLLGTHRGDGDVMRTSAYGGVTVRWTTHLYQPAELTSMLTAAGLEPVAELHRAPSPPSDRAQLVVVGRRT